MDSDQLVHVDIELWENTEYAAVSSTTGLAPGTW